MKDEVGFFDPKQPIADLIGNLPHWRQEGVTYFATFRLADSIPESAIDRMKCERAQWLRRNPEPHDIETRAEYYELFVKRMLHWMDAGHGDCHLRRAEVRQVVAKALSHFDEDRYVLREWIIMPNHVHAVVSPIAGNSLSTIRHSWKSFTANEINRLLGRSGPLWQKETFDHIARGPEHLERIERYIHENAAELPEGTYTRGCLHGKVDAASSRI